MLYFDRIDALEGTHVNKKVHRKSAMFVTIGISCISVLSFKQMSTVDAVFY